MNTQNQLDNQMTPCEKLKQEALLEVERKDAESLSLYGKWYNESFELLKKEFPILERKDRHTVILCGEEFHLWTDGEMISNRNGIDKDGIRNKYQYGLHLKRVERYENVWYRKIWRKIFGKK